MMVVLRQFSNKLKPHSNKLKNKEWLVLQFHSINDLFGVSMEFFMLSIRIKSKFDPFFNGTVYYLWAWSNI